MNREKLEHLLTSPEAAEERGAMSNERWKHLASAYLGMVYHDNLSAKLNQSKPVEMTQGDIDDKIARLSERAEVHLAIAEDFKNSQAQRDQELAKANQINQQIEKLEKKQKAMAGGAYPWRSHID